MWRGDGVSKVTVAKSIRARKEVFERIRWVCLVGLVLKMRVARHLLEDSGRTLRALVEARHLKSNAYSAKYT